MVDRLDKVALVNSGKGFGRVFIDFLLFECDLGNYAGVPTPALLSSITQRAVEMDPNRMVRVYSRQVLGWHCGDYKMPLWAAQASMDVAIHNGFSIRHLADCMAVAISCEHRINHDLGDFSVISEVIKAEFNLYVPDDIYDLMCHLWPLYSKGVDGDVVGER